MSSAKEPPLDLQKGHRYFAADCFNRAWEFIDKTERSVDDELAMIQLGLASLWHWEQFEGCTNVNRSIGFWQMSRIFTLVNQPKYATAYAEKCLEVSKDESAFCLGYAYEALARSAKLSGDDASKEKFLQLATEQADLVDDAEDQNLLKKDLAELGA